MSTNDQTIKCSADGMALLILLIKNALLTMVTLGIYSFWGQVEVQKYLYNNLPFQGKSFDYTATGTERFLAFLKVMGGFLAVVIVVAILAKLAPILGVIAMLCLYLGFFLAFPIIMFTAQRYALSRTTLNNLSFALEGDPKEFAIMSYKYIFLSAVTLGIMTPWLVVNQRKYMYSKMRYGNVRFEFTGDPQELLMMIIIGYLLTMVTLGIYSVWFMENLEEYFFNNTKINGVACTYKKDPIERLKVTILSVMLIIFTGGLASPWAILMILNYTLEHFHYPKQLDFSQIYGAPGQGDAGADALFDALT